MQTFCTLKDLQRLQAVAAFAFPDGAFAGAGGAGGVLVNLSGEHFVRADDNEGVLAQRANEGGRVFSQQDAAKSVKHGSRILRDWVAGFS